MTSPSRHTQFEEDLMDLMESYLETRLFHDANIPEVNELFMEMYYRIADLVKEKA